MIRFVKRLFCPHKKLDFVRNIYGDEIIEYGWKRSIWRCAKCDVQQSLSISEKGRVRSAPGPFHVFFW